MFLALASPVEHKLTLKTLLVSDTVVEIDGTGGFSCYGVGVPEPSIMWQRIDGTSLPAHFAQDADGNLRVKGMVDMFLYLCWDIFDKLRKEVRETWMCGVLRCIHSW